jgi:hypothetical protein
LPLNGEASQLMVGPTSLTRSLRRLDKGARKCRGRLSPWPRGMHVAGGHQLRPRCMQQQPAGASSTLKPAPARRSLDEGVCPMAAHVGKVGGQVRPPHGAVDQEEVPGGGGSTASRGHGPAGRQQPSQPLRDQCTGGSPNLPHPRHAPTCTCPAAPCRCPAAASPRCPSRSSCCGARCSARWAAAQAAASRWPRSWPRRTARTPR